MSNDDQNRPKMEPMAIYPRFALVKNADADTQKAIANFQKWISATTIGVTTGDK